MKKFTIATSLSLVLTGSVFANDTNWYMGVGVGQTNTDTQISNTTGNAKLDEKDLGYKIFAGYKINKYVATEIFYSDLGSSKLTGNNGDNFNYKGNTYQFTVDGAKIESNAASFGISGVFSYPAHKYFEPFAKLGLQKWEYELNATSATTASATIKDDGVDILYGAGFNVPIMESFSLRTEYEVYKFKDGDVNFLSVGLLYKF